MATVRRSAAGQFASAQPRDAHFSLQIIRDVANAATGDDPRQDPLRVTHDQFKAAASRPELVERYGGIPTPNALCARFPDRDGQPMPWRALLAHAFATEEEERSADSVLREHLARQRVEIDKHLSDEHIHFALNYVARAESKRNGHPVRILRAATYDHGRVRLITADRKRRATLGLERMLPTRRQIERVAGGWLSACDIAGLERPSISTVDGRRGLPPVEVAIRFYDESGGYLPSYRQAFAFARDRHLSMAAFTESWPRDVVPAARAEIERRGLPAAYPYDPRSNPKVEPPDDYEPDPDDPIAQTRARWSNKPLVLQFVFEYLDWLGPRPSTLWQWGQFRDARARQGVAVPEVEALRQHGGLASLAREASLPGALERAIAEYEREPTPEERAEQERLEIERAASTPQAQELLTLLRAQGELTPQKIAERMNWSRTTVVVWVYALRRAGLVASTHQDPHHRRVRYFALSEGQGEEDLRAIQVRRETELRAEHESAQRLLALLRSDDYFAPKTLREHLGWSRSMVMDTLTALIAAGLAAATHGGKTRRVQYFAVRDGSTEAEIAAVRAEIEGRVEGDRSEAQQLLQLLRENRALTAPELQALSGLGEWVVWSSLKPLVARGLVATSNERAGKHARRYIALDPGCTGEQLDALRVYWDNQLLPSAGDAHRLHEWMLGQGREVAPREIGEAFGWGKTKTTEQLKKLERAGLATSNGQNRQNVRWQSCANEPPPGGWVQSG